MSGGVGESALMSAAFADTAALTAAEAVAADAAAIAAANAAATTTATIMELSRERSHFSRGKKKPANWRA